MNYFSDLEHFGTLNTSKSQMSPHGKVGFIMGDEMAYQPEPPDLSEERFTFLSVVQSKAIPWSKLSVVISSYEYTLGKIKILLFLLFLHRCIHTSI